MKKIVQVFCLLGWIASDLSAQSNTVASGGNASGSGGSASYSIGQIDYTLKSGTGGISTEGVQQPYEIIILTGVTEKRVDLNAVVFPNPASDYVELRINSNANEQLSYELFDLTGKSVSKNMITGDHTQIDLATVSGGIYYLKVSSSGQVIKTFQINAVK